MDLRSRHNWYWNQQLFIRPVFAQQQDFLNWCLYSWEEILGKNYIENKIQVEDICCQLSPCLSLWQCRQQEAMPEEKVISIFGFMETWIRWSSRFYQGIQWCPTLTAPDTWIDCSCPKLIIRELVFIASPKRQYLDKEGCLGMLVEPLCRVKPVTSIVYCILTVVTLWHWV